MPPGGKDTREHSVSKVWQRLELGVLVAAVLVVWGLLSLPVVFYHLPIDVSCVQNCNGSLNILIISTIENTIHSGFTVCTLIICEACRMTVHGA